MVVGFRYPDSMTSSPQNINDDEIAEAEVVEDGATTADVSGGAILELAERGPLMTAAAPLDQIAMAFTDHVKLVERIVTRDDWQAIQGKQFLKKGGLRKLATAYGVSAEIIDRDLTVDPATGRITRAEFVVRATAPNGRVMDGYGSCDLTDKCKGSACKKDGHDPADHFSHPNHDIPATAETRAKNRAFSDLFAMGQVTAEEVGDQEVWEVLGWPSSAGFRSLMDTLSAALKADHALAAEWKEWRTSKDIGWPVPYAAARDVRAWMSTHIGTVDDDEYHEAPGTGEGPSVTSGTAVHQDTAAAPPSSPGDRVARERAQMAGPTRTLERPKKETGAGSGPPSKQQLQRLAIACNELAGDSDKDRYRHGLIDAVTEGRVQSASSATKDEVRVAIDATVKIRDGKARLVVHPDEGRIAKLEAIG